MRFLSFLFCSLFFQVSAQDQIDQIDVQRYGYYINVNDSNNTIVVSATVILEVKQEIDSFYLDLTSVQTTGKGMQIDQLIGVQENAGTIDFKDVAYKQLNDKLWIYPLNGQPGKILSFTFTYSGEPTNGLIIGENKYGKRTFFGDNWPNRAHHWLACVDHPLDKAKVTFSVEAPNHYQCIATGSHITTIKDKHNAVHYYQSEIDLPTKVMVIGLAEFEKTNYALDFPFSLESWVYVDNAEIAFADVAIAPQIMNYFINTLGEYPYEKLTHVQSTTMFGGMENAGNIFYDENAFTGENTMEALIAHEVAHQWFGNSASEKDWKYLWLSEGFATYFTDLYFEASYDVEAMNVRLKNERDKVIAFSKTYDHPVIDTTYASLMHLLNPNSYQKGAWILHMLRMKIGTGPFMEGIKQYYNTYQFSNASSEEFEKIMNGYSAENLGPFFDQWLRQSGHPEIKTKYKIKKKKVTITLQQVQKGPAFEFPIDLLFTYQDGSNEVRTVLMKDKSFSGIEKTTKKVKHISLDPHVRLLYEPFVINVKDF